jgi:hypothetical protein
VDAPALRARRAHEAGGARRVGGGGTGEGGKAAGCVILRNVRFISDVGCLYLHRSRRYVRGVCWTNKWISLSHLEWKWGFSFEWEKHASHSRTDVSLTGRGGRRELKTDPTRRAPD